MGFFNLSNPQKNQAKAPTPKSGPINTKDLSWKLRSHKNELYTKYKLTGKEVDKLAEGLKKYNTVIDKKEAYKLGKELNKTFKASPDFKERIKAGHKLDLFNDKGVIKKP